ncbi:OmpA family protein [Laceyella tengchongensis]|jgi:outer membrane protein OmpA-like peptidoglycan-associated protein|uniref:OmpA family protein n=1 Tax=Laceyella tengchongensis TaxID=574699 RepID=UPI0012B73C9A|nr:OmpA family protein [Laceyella tengchongensis]
MRRILSVVMAGSVAMFVAACSNGKTVADQQAQKEEKSSSNQSEALYVAPDPDDLYKVAPAEDLYQPPKMYIPAPPYTPPKMAPANFKYVPPEMIHPDMEIKTTDKHVVIELPEHILFDTDSAVLRKEAYPALAQIAKSLSKTENAHFQIHGHTDHRGTHEHNLQLSQERADAVKKALVEKFSVNEALLSTKGWGETKPLVANDSPENMQKNRRVEVIVVPSG